MGSLPVRRLGRACSGLLRVLPAVAGSLPFARHGPAVGAGLSSQAGTGARLRCSARGPCAHAFCAAAGSSPAATAERTRWTLGARSSKPANEELKPDLVTTVRASPRRVAFGPQADIFRSVLQYLSETCMSKMELNTLAMRAARASQARHASDTGSSEVQGKCCARQLPAGLAWRLTRALAATVSILTQRIVYMTEHLRAHPKDKHSRLGLMGMLSHRKKLLQYLRRTDGDRYAKLLSDMGMKDK